MQLHQNIINDHGLAVMATTSTLEPFEAGAKSTTTIKESAGILYPGDMEDMHRNPGTFLELCRAWSDDEEATRSR